MLSGRFDEDDIQTFLAIILLGKPVSIALYSLGLWMFMTKLIPMF